MIPSTVPPETLGAGELQDVIDLKVYRYTDSKDIPHLQSVWIPNKEELAMIIAGYGIYVDLWGTTHAPLSVGVHHEITQNDEA